MLCDVFLSIRMSWLIHPQDFVIPHLNCEPNMIGYSPQSHLHNHFLAPYLFLPTTLIATNLPNL